MKKLIVFFSICASLHLTAQTTAELDSIVRYFDKNNLFHGTVLVAKGGKIVLNKGYGFADAAAKKHNEPGGLFQIGSVTKQFTAVAIVKLQQEGKLSVDDKISKYFPALKDGDKITIHHLLTHTSGLYNYTNDTAFWLREAKQPSSQAQMIARFANKPLDFEPGTMFSYSNSGYLLLGYIIEKVSGKPYEQYIRETIFQPLNMTHSGFDFVKAKNKPTGYYDNGTVNQPSFIVDSTGSYAAGSIYSTTEDLYKWIQGMHQKKILKPELWQTAVTPFKNGYAYGVIADKLYGVSRIWHNGGIHGFVSNLEYIPDSNIVVVLLSNYMQSDLTKLSTAISAALFNKPYALPKIRTEIKLSAELLRRYEGEYRLTPDFSIIVTVKEGRLMAQATGQADYEIYAEKEDHFFYKVVDAQLEFEKDADGKIKSFILHQNGMHLKGEKIQ